MRPSRGMGDINPSKMPVAKKKARKDDTDFTQYKEGGKVKSKVNEAGNYTKPELRKEFLIALKLQRCKALAQDNGQPVKPS